MRIIQLQLCVLIWYQAAETLDQLTVLGENVTINCDLGEKEVYWVSLKQSDSPTVILRSFLSTSLAFYFNKTFENKYSVQSKHRLVIYNVTQDDLGVYYCMNTDTPPKLSNSTRLHIIEPTQLTECKNHTDITLKEGHWTRWKTFTLIFGLLNGVLIITVIGLLKVYAIQNGCWNRSGNSSRQHHKTDLQQTQVLEDPQDPNQLQYAAVDFSKLRKHIRPSHDNSIYATLQLPKS